MSFPKHHDSTENISSLLEHSIGRFKGFQIPAGSHGENDSAVRAGAHALLVMKELSGKLSYCSHRSETNLIPQLQSSTTPSSSQQRNHEPISTTTTIPFQYQPRLSPLMVTATQSLGPLGPPSRSERLERHHQGHDRRKEQASPNSIQPVAVRHSNSPFNNNCHNDDGQGSQSGRDSAHQELDGIKITALTSSQISSYKGLSVEGKKALRRKQNTQSARQTRQKNRLRMEMMKKEYEANEERIKYLTKVADDFLKELQVKEKLPPPCDIASRTTTKRSFKRKDVPVRTFSGRYAPLEGPTF